MDFDKFDSFSKLEDGIYYVKKSNTGYESSYLCSKLDNLPEAMSAAAFERMKYQLAKNISFYLRTDIEITTSDIMKEIKRAFIKYGTKE